MGINLHAINFLLLNSFFPILGQIYNFIRKRNDRKNLYKENNINLQKLKINKILRK